MHTISSNNVHQIKHYNIHINRFLGVSKWVLSINKPKQKVFEDNKLLKNQNNYSKWAGMYPNMVETYKGTVGAIGFISAWESDLEDVGSGEQEIRKITEGERIDFELRFIESFESIEAVYMATEVITDNQTNLTWGFNGSADYQMNLFSLIMDFESLIGNDL